MVIFLYYVSLWKDGKVLKGFIFKIFTTKKLAVIQLPSKYYQKFCLLYNIFVRQELYNFFYMENKSRVFCCNLKSQ